MRSSGSQSSPLAASFEQAPKLADAFEGSADTEHEDVRGLRLPGTTAARFVDTFAKEYGIELAEIAVRSYIAGRQDADLPQPPALNAVATDCGAAVFRLFDRIAERNRKAMDDA